MVLKPGLGLTSNKKIFSPCNIKSKLLIPCSEKVLEIFFTRPWIFFDKLVLIFFVTKLLIKNKPFFEFLVI